LGIALSPVPNNPNMVWFHGGVYYVFRYWSLVLCMDGQVPDQRSIGSKEVSVESKKLEAQ
jgi:hypothetical protein